MPDNVDVTPGAGATVATDEISGVQYQRVKPAWGVDGSAVDTSATNPLPTQLAPIATGGATIYRRISAASTNGERVKNGAGTLYGILAVNTNAAARYLKIYNNTNNPPAVGTDTPVLTIPLPGAGGVAFPIAQGINFGTGIGIGITTGAADSDTGAVAANEIVVHLFYA